MCPWPMVLINLLSGAQNGTWEGILQHVTQFCVILRNHFTTCCVILRHFTQFYIILRHFTSSFYVVILRSHSTISLRFHYYFMTVS